MSMRSAALDRTLIAIPDTRPLARLSWAVLLLAVGVGFITLTAQVRIPVPGSPVPITGSTLGVLLVAAAYGARMGSATVGAYLLVGVAGAPVFQNGGAGMAALNGATGGYLIGFLAASWIVGELAESRWDRVPWMAVLAMVIGNVVIYACGVTHLSGIIGWENVWSKGVQPFLIGDAIKIAIAAGVLPAAWRLKARNTPR